MIRFNGLINVQPQLDLELYLLTCAIADLCTTKMMTPDATLQGTDDPRMLYRSVPNSTCQSAVFLAKVPLCACVCCHAANPDPNGSFFDLQGIQCSTRRQNQQHFRSTIRVCADVCCTADAVTSKA